MSKLFVQYVSHLPIQSLVRVYFHNYHHPPVSALILSFKDLLTDIKSSGLSWHTNDETLREGFQQFGEIQEAVCVPAQCPVYSNRKCSYTHPFHRSWSRTVQLCAAVGLDSSASLPRLKLKPP